MDEQRFDALTRRLVTGTSRRRVLRGLTAGAAAAALGRGAAVAAPNRCQALASLFFPPGAGRATFKQACQRCDADLERICETDILAFTCCPEGQGCCHDCREGFRHECGQPDEACPLCCEGTVPEEGCPEFE